MNHSPLTRYSPRSVCELTRTMLQGTNNNDMLSVNSFQMPPFTGGLSIGNFTINGETPVQSPTALHSIPLLFFLGGMLHDVHLVPCG